MTRPGTASALSDPMFLRIIQYCNRTTLRPASTASVLTPGVFVTHVNFLTEMGVTLQLSIRPYAGKIAQLTFLSSGVLCTEQKIGAEL